MLWQRRGPPYDAAYAAAPSITELRAMLRETELQHKRAILAVTDPIHRARMLAGRNMTEADLDEVRDAG